MSNILDAFKSHSTSCCVYGYILFYLIEDSFIIFHVIVTLYDDVIFKNISKSLFRDS